MLCIVHSYGSLWELFSDYISTSLFIKKKIFIVYHIDFTIQDDMFYIVENNISESFFISKINK